MATGKAAAKTPAKKTTAKKAATAPGNKVAKRTNTTPVKGNLLGAMRQEAGRGMETMRQEDLALPFLAILQDLSPQVQKRNEKYVDGAEAGDLYNTVTGEVWKAEDGVLIIPCHYNKVFNEWIKRDDGGGFVNSYTDKAEAEMSRNPDHDLVDTGNHFVLIYSEENEQWQEAVLSMTSTKLKVSRQWNSRMKQMKMEDDDGEKFTPPSYAHIYRLTTAGTQNDKGFFHVPVIKSEEWVDDERVYEQARGFYAMMAEGAQNLSYKNVDRDADVIVDDEEEDDKSTPKGRRF